MMIEESKKEEGIRQYYVQKIEEAENQIRERTQNLKRLEAQRNELNSRGIPIHFFEKPIFCLFNEISYFSKNTVRLLREEIVQLMEPGSHVGEVTKLMSKNKVLVKVNPEGKYVVDVDKKIDITKLTPNTRVVNSFIKKRNKLFESHSKKKRHYAMIRMSCIKFCQTRLILS